MSFPLFAVNFLLFGPFFREVSAFEPFRHLRDNVVKPLADELNIFSAFFIAVFAGVGEELFFRGLVQEELGAIIAAVLFSFLHFGVAARRYLPVVIVYFFIGLYFSYLSYDSLWVAIVTHITYDYFILLYMRYVYNKALVREVT